MSLVLEWLRRIRNLFVQFPLSRHLTDFSRKHSIKTGMKFCGISFRNHFTLPLPLGRRSLHRLACGLRLIGASSGDVLDHAGLVSDGETRLHPIEVFGEPEPGH